MDDPTPAKKYPTEEDLFAGPDEWLADVRSWRAEQRAKYGMDWEDTDPPGRSDYERSRGMIPPDTPIPSEERRKNLQQK
jgi:hypothetical protein